MQIHLNHLDFEYPERLIATAMRSPSRVMWVEGEEPCELSVAELLSKFDSGDVLVLNDTKVLRRRVFAEDGTEILFLSRRSPNQWAVLCPAGRMRDHESKILPGGLKVTLLERGRPQLLEVDREINESYFDQFGEPPLPPYIQKARGERHAQDLDRTSYQSAWAQKPGSLAAPTASFHLNNKHLQNLTERGVAVVRVTLHIGLGTFLPLSEEQLISSQLHEEPVAIERSTWQTIMAAKQRGKAVWALGTTVTRALEACVRLPWPEEQVEFSFTTNLFIHSDFEFQIIDRLLTNFHQPRSSLLALVGAFAGIEKALRCYRWAIEREFLLFSYGDLSAWKKA